MNKGRKPDGDPSARDAGNGPVGKVFDILGLVVASPGHSTTTAEIAEALSIPRPTVNRLVGNLVKLGLLKRDITTRRLIEGDRLIALAHGAFQGAARRCQSHEILKQVVIETRETCNLGLLHGGRVTYLDRVEAAWPLALRLDVGSEVPLYCSALGKLFLSRMPPKLRARHLAGWKLEKMADNTITDPDALQRNLDEIAQSGVSCDYEECFRGVVGFAVAVETGPGLPVLGLSMAAPSARVTIDDLLHHLPVMRQAAAQLGRCFTD